MSCVGDSVLANYQSGGNDMENNGTDTVNEGQSFKIPNAATVCAFSWFGGKGTAGTQPGTFKIELLAGGYAGTVIATTGVLNSSIMADWGSPAWYKFEFETPVALEADTTYYIKCTQLSGSTNDVIRWFTDSVGATYADGTAWRANVEQTGADKYFRIHGVEIVTTYAISGVVTLSGAPVEGATVRCVRQSDNVAITSQTTDSSGAYSFDDLDVTELYHVSVEASVASVDYNALSYWDIVPVEVE